MSSFGESFSRIEEENLSSYASSDNFLGMPWNATKTPSSSNFSNHSSPPSQTMAPHQTEGAQVKGRTVAKASEDTADEPSKKKRTTKRALACERGPAIKLIPGFDHWSKALPDDLQHEDIIKKYPNHLHGELLLKIAGTWTPTEISRTCGRPELPANTIVKRIRAAKNKRDGVRRKSGKSTKAPPKTTPPPESATSSAVHSDETGVPGPAGESEASLRFLTQQTELQDILWELDPTRITRSTTDRGNKNPELDRQLIELAVQERQRRIDLE